MATDQECFDFLRSTVRSVWTLELLLLLRRTSPRPWSADDLMREMRASTNIVVESLARLDAAGILAVSEGQFSYSPASPALAALSDALDLKYRESPVRIVNAIAAPVDDKLRALSDAFRMKGAST